MSHACKKSRTIWHDFIADSSTVTESSDEEETSSSGSEAPVIARRSKFEDEEDDSDVCHSSACSLLPWSTDGIRLSTTGMPQKIQKSRRKKQRRQQKQRLRQMPKQPRTRSPNRNGSRRSEPNTCEGSWKRTTKQAARRTTQPRESDYGKQNKRQTLSTPRIFLGILVSIRIAVHQKLSLPIRMTPRRLSTSPHYRYLIQLPRSNSSDSEKLLCLSLPPTVRRLSTLSSCRNSPSRLSRSCRVSRSRR